MFVILTVEHERMKPTFWKQLEELPFSSQVMHWIPDEAQRYYVNKPPTPKSIIYQNIPEYTIIYCNILSYSSIFFSIIPINKP